MSEYKILAQRIGLIGLANVLVNLSGIFLLPILTKSLPVEDYGIWAQVNVTITLASVVICLGLSASMVRFMAASSSREEIQECFYSILAVVMVSGFVASALIFCFAGPIAGALFNGNVAVTRALSVIVFVEAINSLLFSYYRAMQRMKLYAIFSVTVVYITIVLTFWFVRLGYGIYGAVVGLAISKMSILAIMWILLLRHIGYRRPMFRHLGEYFSFGLPIVPTAIFDWIVNSSDRYVIGILLGTAWVGYYSPGYLIGSMIAIFVSPIATVLPVVLYKYYDHGNINAIETIMGLTIKYLLALTIPSVFGLSLLSKPMLVMLSTPDIAEQSYLVTPFVAIGMLFMGMASVMSNVIYIVKKTSISMKISLMAAVIKLFLLLALVQLAGVMGAAAAALFAFIFIFLANRYFALIFLKVRLDCVFILKSVLASSVMSLLIFFWTPNSFFGILGYILISMLIYLSVILMIKGINRDEIKFIKSLLYA